MDKGLEKIYFNLAKSICSSLDFKRVLGSIKRELAKNLPDKNWSILRYDPTAEELFFVLAKGINLKKVSKFRLRKGEGIAGAVVETKKILYEKNVKKSKKFSDKVDKITNLTTENIYAVPIIFNDNVLGVFEVVNFSSLTKRDIRVIEAVTSFSAIAMNNAIQYNEMIVNSFLDPLTRTYTRKKLQELMSSANRRKLSQEECVCVAYIDIDKFKSINDTYGHSRGDSVLQTLATQLSGCIRREDYIFRMGGDEFLVILGNVSSEDIERVKNNLVAQLTAINEKNKELYQFSFGIEVSHYKNLQKLIQKSDRLMYSEKRKR